MNATKRYRRLSDVPLRTLRRWLRAAETTLGRDSGTATVLRRAISNRESESYGK